MARQTLDAVVIIDESQMECTRGPQREQCIFFSMIQNSRTEIRCHAVRVIYNEATETNDELGTEVFPGSEFSEWWEKKRKTGWRFCS